MTEPLTTKKRGIPPPIVGTVPESNFSTNPYLGKPLSCISIWMIASLLSSRVVTKRPSTQQSNSECWASLDEMIGWYTDPNVIQYFETLATRQLVKNTLFAHRLRRHLVPGSLLEFGAGNGQLSKIFADMGFDVLATEIHTHLVEYMRAKGLTTRVVDARRAKEFLDISFDNVFAQGLHTLLTKNLEGTAETYRSAWEVLKPGGHFIVVLANAYRPRRWSTIDSHYPLIELAGLKIAAHFRDQVLPSVWYTRLPAFILNTVEYSIGRRFGIRNVLVLERPIAHE